MTLIPRIISREIEVKFKIEKPNLIRRILKNQRAKFIGKVLERTLRFDTPIMSLKERVNFCVFEQDLKMFRN